MPRIPLTPQARERFAALTDGDPFAQMVREMGPRRARARAIPKRSRERFREELAVMVESNDFAAMKPAHMVSLYAALHERVYGVAPAELEVGSEFMEACAAAGRLLRGALKGERTVVPKFMIWCWQREKERVEWRKNNGKPPARMGWRLQFNPSMATDWLHACVVARGDG